MHVKARCAVYPVRRDEERHGDIQRLPIPDTQVSRQKRNTPQIR